jgi:flagellar basal-body rod modification protein FlgD
MSYIDVINQASTAAAQTKANEADMGNDIMGKEDFLTLLVAQLQNQDPLNPDDPTEFTAQLAQFSSLEQLFQLNESMDNVASSVNDSQKLAALSMIGKEVAYADSEFKFEGDPVQIGYSIDGEAKDITLLLQKDGATVTTLKGTELQKGDHFISWNGLTASGKPAPTGDYTIVIEATAAADSIAAAPLVRSEVTGVDLDSTSGGLLFTVSGEIEVNKIKGVYELGTGLNQEEPAQQETNATVEETAADAAEAIAEIAEETVPTEG